MLGPILFLIFINYLPDNINSTFYLFNDERAFYRNIRRFEFFLCFRFDALTELGAFMRTEFLCISVLRVASGPRVKLDSCKSALPPPPPPPPPRWFALPTVLRRLVLLFVALWFILRDDLLYVFPCVILFLCFSVLLDYVAWGRES